MDERFTEWRRQYQYIEGSRETDRGIEVPVTGRSEIRLDPPPGGVTGELRLTDVGTTHDDVRLDILGGASYRLVVVASSALRTLRFQSSSGQAGMPQVLEVEGLATAEHAVALHGFSPSGSLNLRRGRFHIAFDGVPTQLILNDCSIEASSTKHVEAAELKGTVQFLETNLLEARKTTVGKDVHLVSKGGISLGEIEALDGSLVFKLSGGASAASVADGATLDFELSHDPQTTLQLGNNRTPVDQPISELTVTGHGRLDSFWSLDKACFDGKARGDLAIHIGDGRQVTDATGACDVVAPNAIVIGEPSKGLRLLRLIGANGGSLSSVDVYDLQISDLAALEQTLRFVPVFPGRNEARKRLKEMSLGASDPQEISSQRAYFWSNMVPLVKSKHASGDIQSETRYAAMLSRRWAPGRKREKALLWLYEQIEFGERIGRPLFLLTLASLLAAFVQEAPWAHPNFSSQDVLSFLQNWVRFSLSPLSFFRAEGVPKPAVFEDFAPRLGVAVVQVFNTIMLIFALIAMRRIAKAE